MGLTQTIAELMLEKGRAQSGGALGSGQAWGSGLSQIGQTIGQIPQQIAQQNAEGQTAQLRQGQIDELTQRKNDLKSLDDAFGKQGGRDAIISALPGHLRPQVMKQFADADESAAKVQESALAAEKATNEYVGMLADNIEAHGYDPSATQIALAHAKDTFKNNPSMLSQVGQFEQAIQANPTPDGVKAVIAPIIQARESAEKPVAVPRGGTLATPQGKVLLAPQVTPLTPEESALKVGQLKEIDAKLAGTVPMSAKDRAELQIQRGRLAEDIRNHNQVNNPLGLGTPPATGAAPASQGQAGADFLATLPPGAQTTVKALAEGRMAFPGGAAMRSPYWQSMVSAVGQYDPSFDTTNFNARNKTRSDLESPSGKGGQSIGAINTALRHAGTLSDLIEKLDNSNIPLANAVVNPLKSATGNTAVTNFNAVAPQLMKEIEKAWRGTGGSAGEIQDLIKSIGQNQGKQQQREALGQFVDLLKGKLDSLQQQRDNALGPVVAPTVPVLFDQNKPVMDKIATRAAGGSDATSQQKIATVDQIKQIADKAGVTYAEAKAHAESQGYVVK